MPGKGLGSLCLLLPAYYMLPITCCLPVCSFGHAILDILSKDRLQFSWFRNQDGQAVAAENVTLVHQPGCANHKRKVAAGRGSRA